MNWIEKNKVAASIMGATIVVSGILIILGRGANSDAELARKRELASVNKINSLQAAKPYPNKENEQLLAKNLSIFAADTKKFQDQLLTFRPDEMNELSANEFNGEVSAYINKLTGIYKSKKIALPNKGRCFFGMELYANEMAVEGTTSYLSYNRQALEWLFTVLADSGINSLNNVYRAPSAEALAKTDKQVPVLPAKPVNPKAKVPPPVAITSVYDGLPIEITFTGTEASLEKFITEVAAGEEYFFSLRYLKVVNEEQDPVVISKATFPPAAPPAEESTDAAPFEGAEVAPEVAPEAAPEAGAVFGELFEVEEDKEIIKQIIGDEKITVFLMFDLIHFKEDTSVTIPRLVTESPEKVITK